MIDSKIFAGTEGMAIGLCSDTSVVLIFLGVGTTFVTFHAVGTVEDDRHRLKMYFSGLRRKLPHPL